MHIKEVILQFTSRFDPRGMASMMTSLKKAESEAEKFENTLKKISAAFLGFAASGVMAFKQYEMSLTEFSGKAMNSVEEFGRKFSKVSGDISRETGAIRHEVLRGLQESTSALLDPRDAVKLTRKAAILSAGNQSLLRQAISVALSGTRNKFGKPATVLDYAYASAQLGQGQVAEFAPALQYVFGFARGAGLKLKEVAAGIAAISATAPSPLMGSTQFGAFLTGIARGSTYEQKLKDKAGVSSQDLRDMLRGEGLAHTVEFLASKFTGDELQQVFGRKEFVQFVQGTTGRRGIVRKLEDLIEQNVANQPIERFGADLEMTLANKFDRFMQTIRQLGTEFGEPIAKLAKVLLTVVQKIADIFLWFNEKTGGLFAWFVTIMGGLLTRFLLFDRLSRSNILGNIGGVFGLKNFVKGKLFTPETAARAGGVSSGVYAGVGSFGGTMAGEAVAESVAAAVGDRAEKAAAKKATEEAVESVRKHYSKKRADRRAHDAAHAAGGGSRRRTRSAAEKAADAQEAVFMYETYQEMRARARRDGVGRYSGRTPEYVPPFSERPIRPDDPDRYFRGPWKKEWNERAGRKAWFREYYLFEDYMEDAHRGLLGSKGENKRFSEWHLGEGMPPPDSFEGLNARGRQYYRDEREKRLAKEAEQLGRASKRKNVGPASAKSRYAKLQSVLAANDARRARDAARQAKWDRKIREIRHPGPYQTSFDFGISFGAAGHPLSSGGQGVGRP